MPRVQESRHILSQMQVDAAFAAGNIFEIRIFVTREPLRNVQVLIIQLMRWRSTEDGEKQPVVHPVLLDAELKVEKAVYSLVAVVRMHQGVLHYTTLAKRRGRGSRLKWWKYNDDVAAEVDEEEVLVGHNAYVLF